MSRAPDARRISCEEALRRLDDYLDRELDTRTLADVEAHLRECEACAREYRFERAMLDQVRAKLRAVTLPTALRDRIVGLLANA